VSFLDPLGATRGVAPIMSRRPIRAGHTHVSGAIVVSPGGIEPDPLERRGPRVGLLDARSGDHTGFACMCLLRKGVGPTEADTEVQEEKYSKFRLNQTSKEDQTKHKDEHQNRNQQPRRSDAAGGPPRGRGGR